MGKQKNTIIVNGKVLDANTGSQVSGGNAHVKNMDGFIRRTATVQPGPTKVSLKPKDKPKVAHPVHAANDVHKRHEHSKTLMRSAVTKPHTPKLAALTTRLQVNDSVATVSIPVAHTIPRHKRASNIAKSSLIKRFNMGSPEPLVVKKTAPLHVKTHPKEHINGHNDSPIIESIAEKPLSTAGEDMFAAALSHATSHEKPSLKLSRRKHRIAKKLGISARAANIMVSVAIIVVLGGFIAYQNAPNIAMHMAVAKAGVSGSLPGYKPSGFAISRHIQAQPGQIVVSFHSNSDSRNFSISQTASDWNSQTLLDNYVAVNDQQYQRVSQDNGKTVFIYGDASATWVDGGIWYNITGKSSLSNDQLLKLANSF